MLRGLNVDAYFRKKGPMTEEAQQYEKGVWKEKIVKQKTIKPEW